MSDMLAVLERWTRNDDPIAEIVDIGPECFGLADGSVICWRGQNYTPQRLGVRARLHNFIVGRLGVSHVE